MNSDARKQTFSQESSDAGNSPLTPKHRDVITRDMTEKPFPTKPVCHRKVDKSISYVIDINSKSQDPRHCMLLDKDQSRSLAGELHLTKLIHEKQLMLQKKLLKVEDMLREKVQPHNVGIVHVYKGNQLVEKKQSGKRQEILKPDTKNMQTSEVKCSEIMTKGQIHKQEQKIRPDKTEQKPKWDPKNAGGTMTKRKEESNAQPGNSEQTTDYRKLATETLQKASSELATNDKAAERTLHKEPLPQVSVSLSELEHMDQSPPGLPCRVCNRSFNKLDRLQKHMSICEKLKTKKRPIFNVTLQRIKGTDFEKYLKPHARCTTSEILKKKKQDQRQKKAT